MTTLDRLWNGEECVASADMTKLIIGAFTGIS
jgi:hypothetical protein